MEQINEINELILKLKRDAEVKSKADSNYDNENQNPNQGTLIVDATACPQNIAYPTDLDLLNDTREKSEELLDFVFSQTRLSIKPRNYRKKAHKDYLKTAQKKNKNRKEICMAIRK